MSVKQLKIRFAATAVVFVTPFIAQAAIVPCGDQRKADGTIQNPCQISDFFNLAVGIYNLLLGAAALVAMIMIILAGIQMLIYQWGEQPPSALESAKLTLRRAIFGLIIIITAYIVANTLLTLLGFGGAANIFNRGVL